MLEWGAVRLQLKADKAVNVVGDCTIKLRDEDKVLFNYFQSIEPQRAQVAIYQQFRGNAESDLVQLHAGIINAPCTWSEKDHAVLLDITDISTYFNRTVGNFADRLDYPNVVQTDENKLIPLVFGHVMRARAVALDFGPVTELARDLQLLRHGPVRQRRGVLPAAHADADLDRRRADERSVQRQLLQHLRARRADLHRHRHGARRGLPAHGG